MLFSGTLTVLILIVVVIAHPDLRPIIASGESRIEQLGPWAPIVFIAALVAGTTLFIPEALFAVSAGTLFGFQRGAAVIIVGSFVAAAAQYWLSQHLLRRRITRLLAERPVLDAIAHAVHRDALRLQSLLRLTPLSPTTLSYVFGAAGVRFTTFMIACGAQIPVLLLEVWIGHESRDIARASTQGGALELRHVVTAVGVIIALAVMFRVFGIARRAVAAAVAAEAAEAAEQASAPDH